MVAHIGYKIDNEKSLKQHTERDIHTHTHPANCHRHSYSRTPSPPQPLPVSHCQRLKSRTNFAFAQRVYCFASNLFKRIIIWLIIANNSNEAVLKHFPERMGK